MRLLHRQLVLQRRGQRRLPLCLHLRISLVELLLVLHLRVHQMGCLRQLHLLHLRLVQHHLRTHLGLNRHRPPVWIQRNGGGVGRLPP